MVESRKAFDEKELEVQHADSREVETVAVLQSTPSSSISDDDSSDKKRTPSSGTKDKMVASGVTGAVLGFFLGGPIGSALFGFTAAYVSQKDGAPGDAARALGDVGSTVRTKAIEVDEKHNIVEKTKKAAMNTWQKAKQYDEKHRILDYSKDFVVHGWKSFVEFVQERRLLEKGVDTAGKGYEYVAEKLCTPANNVEQDAGSKK